MNIIRRLNDKRLSKIACDEPYDERLKITEKNCEGYVELFKLRYCTEEDMKITYKCLVYTVLGLAIIVPSVFIPTAMPLFISAFFGFEIINLTSFCYKVIKSRKERKRKIIEKYYPYIDFEIDMVELRQALQDCGILSTKEKNGYAYWDIDLENYKKNLSSSKLLKGSDMELPNCMKEGISKRINESKSQEVMDDFMQKLEDDHFDRSESQIGEEFNPTPEFIEQTILNYQKLLELGLIPPFEEESISEEKGPVLKKVRKDNRQN